MSKERQELAIRLADVLAKTLAAAMFPGPAGTFLGEAAGNILDVVAKRPDDGLHRKLQGIADNISQSVIDPQEFRLPANEIDAAISLVCDTIEHLPLTGEVMQDTNLRPDKLALYLFEGAASLRATAALGDAENAYRWILWNTTYRICETLRLSPEAHGLQIETINSALADIRERFSQPTSLAAGISNIERDEYSVRYRIEAAKAVGVHKSPTASTRQGLALSSMFVATTCRTQSGSTSLSQAITAHKRILLCSGPGGGKTTLLREAFLHHLATDSSVGWEKRPPIYIDLHGLDEFPSLEDLGSRLRRFVPRAPNGWAEAVLEHESSLVIIDNVDQYLSNTVRGPQNLSDLNDFIAQVANRCRVALAAREGTLEAEWISANNFVRCDIEDRSPVEILDQVSGWFAAVAETRSTVADAMSVIEQGDSLKRTLRAVSDLLELARTPRLCTILCDTFLDSSIQLPDDWISLMDGVVAAVVGLDSQTEGPTKNKVSLLRKLWQDIALWSVHNRPPINTNHLEDYLRDFNVSSDPEWAPAQVVSSLVSNQNLLLQNVDGTVDFVNESLRTHLAAPELAAAGYFQFIRQRATSPNDAGLVVAVAGRARPDRLNNLVDSLLQDSAQNVAAAPVILAVAHRCVNVALSVEPGLALQVADSLLDLLRVGDPADPPYDTILGIDAILPLLSSRPSERSHLAEICLTVAESSGPYALPALGILPQALPAESQEMLWDAWPKFPALDYAKLVLSECNTVPEWLEVSSPSIFYALHLLPAVRSVHLSCSVPEEFARRVRGLRIRGSQVNLIEFQRILRPDQEIELIFATTKGMESA